MFSTDTILQTWLSSLAWASGNINFVYLLFSWIASDTYIFGFMTFFISFKERIRLFFLRIRKHVPCFFRVIDEHEWKSGRKRNAVGTRAAGERFHSLFEFSQTFTSISITDRKTDNMFSVSFRTPRREKGTQLANFDYQNVSSLCFRCHYVNSKC